MQLSMPVPILRIAEELHLAGYEAYAAGESVRDSILGLAPQELKIITDAPAEMVGVLFGRVYPSQEDGASLTVSIDQIAVEVTCLQKWRGSALDLSAAPIFRGFTADSLCYDPFFGQLIDPWRVSPALHAGVGIIQAAGDPISRFQDDPSLLLKAFYLMKRFDDAGAKWRVEPGTRDALARCASLIAALPQGNLAHQLDRIIVGRRPDLYFGEMLDSGVLKHLLPELADTFGITESGGRIKDVFDHTMLVVKKIRPELHLRWAALLHDIGKPHCISFEGKSVHFYGHQVIGAVISRRILRRLTYSEEFVKRVSFLVLHHMYPTPRTRKAVRRFVAKIGLRNLGDLLELRRADIMGGKYKNIGSLEHFKRELEAVLFELPPFSLKNLDIDGYDVMKALGAKPGPQVGGALRFLLERVGENPQLNHKETLIKILQEEFISTTIS